jgi:hypothetical protein
MSDHYDDLTDTEQCYWNAYTRLRELSDWEGFDEGQAAHKEAARAWLVSQRKEIWRCAEGSKKCDGGPGWNVNQRSERYAQLKDNSLNTGSPRNLCQLPTNGGTPSEKAMISEREMWWNQASVDNTTKGWRQRNADVLTGRRKQVWHLGEDEGWDESERELRYENLCVATKTGEPYDQWAAKHSTTTGQPSSDTGKSARQAAVENCKRYLGVNENPPNSNRGNEIDDWNRRVAGYLGAPWCASFATCMAWDAGAKGGSSASVQYIVNMAKAGSGMFRGWTTDPGVPLRGDLAIISCSSCHVEMVIDSDDAYDTIGGNTSPGSEGSQYDGGCVAHRQRNGEVYGWALVDYPS